MPTEQRHAILPPGRESPQEEAATMLRQGQRIAEDAPAAEPAPDPALLRLGPIGDFAGFALRLAQEASFQAFARRTGDIDLRPGRFATLAIIGENPGLSQTALGQASGRDKSTLTPALDDLVKRGLVKRERTPQDRRSYALTLTPDGEAALRALMEHAAAHDRELDRLIGAAEKPAFMAALRRIVAGLG